MRKVFNRIILNIMIAVMLTSGLSCFWRETRIVKAEEEYEVVWEDNFNGNSLDRSIWNVEVNGNGGGNQELQYYCDNSENIEVSNGTLKIKGLRKSYGGKGYTSGRINTKNKAEFRYGKIEARMKLPSFQGAWPAFWMLGSSYDSIGWPRCGEIDIMEAINTENFTHGALHWYGEGQRGSTGDASEILSNGFDRKAWHTYALEWNEKTMKWTVDGQVFLQEDITNEYMGEFRKKQFIIFNLAIGGQWPGFTIDNSVFPVVMEVDYVRVSQKPSEKGIVSGSGITNKPDVNVPIETETRNVIEYKEPWKVYFNQAVVKGSGISKDATGFTANIDYLGIKARTIRAYMENIDYIPGETYQYSFIMKSDITKNVQVKVVGDDPEEDAFANYGITLEGGQPYYFNEKITIGKDYDGKLSLVVEMGGRAGGEYLPADTKLKVVMENASFVGKAEKLKEIPTQKPTEKETDPDVLATTKESDNNQYTTKKQSDFKESNVGSLKRVKIISIKRVKKGKLIKLKLKKIKEVSGYEIRYSTGKKLKKYKKISGKKISYTLKKVKNNKTYYIKARAYKVVSNKKYYGHWSKIKKVK